MSFTVSLDNLFQGLFIYYNRDNILTLLVPKIICPCLNHLFFYAQRAEEICFHSSCHYPHVSEGYFHNSFLFFCRLNNINSFSHYL